MYICKTLIKLALMNKVPSVDLRDFLSNNLEKKEKFIQTIGSAFQEIGFCAVKGHFLSERTY